MLGDEMMNVVPLQPRVHPRLVQARTVTGSRKKTYKKREQKKK